MAIHCKGSREGVLKPDATLIFGCGGLRQALMIEFDRTARPHKQLDRLRRYDWFLSEGWMHCRFAGHPIAPAVVLITLKESTLTALVRAANQVLSASRGEPDAAPEQRRYYGRERIVSGDWQMLRVPALPPDIRGADRRERVSANEIELDLVALSAGA